MDARALAALTLLALLPVTARSQDLPVPAERAVDFVVDVRPILQRACVECHGSARQRKGLRLDALVALRTGGHAGPVVTPGHSADSLLIRRVVGADGLKRMPPEGEPLAAEEIGVLRAWIDQGARGDDGVDLDARELMHWSYRPVSRPAPPVIAGATHGVDAFVLRRLAPHGVELADEADRATLLRRLSLDLTGLPPTVAEVVAFERDREPGSYERAVDRLLASPAYGERWAQWWLDLARYADTQGYEKDSRRTIWRYRDWVIDAFDQDMPFDEFTVRQLAGDLLPDATVDDVLATAFHRNTMTNSEGGTDDEEFRTAAVIDRVNTTFEVWMGTTIGCAQCHEHKYDPIEQREYYELYAFFDQTADADRNDEAPTIETPTRAQRAKLEVIDGLIADLRTALDRELPDAARRTWEDEQRAALLAYDAMELELGTWQHAGPFADASFDAAFASALGPEAGDVDWAERPEWRDGAVHTPWKDANAAHYLERTVHAANPGRVALSLGSDDAIKVWVDDREVLAKKVSRAAAPDQERVVVDLPAGATRIRVKIVNGGGPSGFYFRPAGPGVDPELAAALRTPMSERTAEQAARIAAAHRADAPELQPVREAIDALVAQRAEMEIVRTPVLQELPEDARRTTRMFVRGSFLNPGAEVSPGVPATFHPWNPEWPRNRLGLARWIVDPQNPLTARVTVNRIWEQLFGTGLVETTEDLGHQGEPPSHPLLLDWLASELVDEGWSLKRLLRTIVTSRTYRQSSVVRAELRDVDPRNRLLGRGPAVRLSGEAVRDSALAIAGLLSDARFGPSVMPPQPDGVWQVVYSGDQWRTSTGEDRYRRALYTFWRRTSPYPSLVAFDAPSREVCVVRRIRTNTPLQALVTLNDPAFVEAAQALARRALREGGREDAARLAWAFRTSTGRRAWPEEIERLHELLRSERRHFTANSDMATRISTDPLGPLPDGLEPAEAAAWTVVANVLLNLDEVLVKR